MLNSRLLLAAATAAIGSLGCASANGPSPVTDTDTDVTDLPFVTNRSVESRDRGRRRMSNRPGELRGGTCSVEIRGDRSRLLQVPPRSSPGRFDMRRRPRSRDSTERLVTNGRSVTS
ncbi:MAG: hypothetical protein QNJ07_16050, partial [Woeseiaceae bacterium]|nr:hypothetical protein [Woeseiaceae bacterium]